MQEKDLQLKRVLRTALFVLLLNVAGMGKGYAYDFSAVCETGQTLYYNIIDAENHYVELTYPGGYSNPFNPWPNSDEKPIGNIVLPSIVNYNDIDYSVTTIGQYAFYNCNSLTGSLIIPNSVITISSSAFLGCSGFNGSLVIPNSVSTIGGGFFHGAFQGCNGFVGDLIIPNSVETIEDYAFFQCSGFSGNLIIPNSVTTIGEGAFRECSGFDGSLTLPNTLVTINRTTFQDCSGFTGSLSIPNTVTSIGGYAFYNCSSFNGTLDLGNSLTSIGEVAFRNCYNFTGSLTIPSSVTSIGYRAFYNCFGFNGLTILGSLTTINDYTFYDCYGFAGSVLIPSSVITIGQYAFCGCYNLSEMIMFAINPPSLGNGAFSMSNYLTISGYPIYVPYESLNVYKSATNWNNYEYINRIFPMTYITVSGYNDTAGNWRFIASPLEVTTAPTIVENMVTDSDYDLYQFNQSAMDGEWQNYKANNFNLLNGQGYLYANAEDVNLIFKGEFYEDETKEVNLVYDAGKPLAGWNLVGNPFPVNAYANRSYYVMNEAGTAIEPVAVSMETAIPPCTGVMVKADNAGETVTFSKIAPEMLGQNNGVLQIAVAEAETSVLRPFDFAQGLQAQGPQVQVSSPLDKAIVSFNTGDRLEKFVFNKDNAQLYIPSGKNNYAIACTEKTGEMPLNFKANKNGVYTITVDAEMVEMEYLHLIDNITGNDVDLLIEPCYTFEAKTNDYASRFRLVFVCGDANDDNESDNEAAFAYFCNGDIIITADAYNASLQVIDVMGRVLVCRDTPSGSVISTAGMTPGVYMLRLINGDDVKVQKIVVR